MRPFIRWLSASEKSSNFLPEIKDVVFCLLIIKSIKKLKSARFWPSYDLFSEVWFSDFSISLGSCSSASSEAILKFSKDLESPVHSLFAIYKNKFSFNEVFRSKTPCGFAYRADFCRFAASPQPPLPANPPTWMWAKMWQPWELVDTFSSLFFNLGLFWVIKQA